MFVLLILCKKKNLKIGIFSKQNDSARIATWENLILNPFKVES